MKRLGLLLPAFVLSSLLGLPTPGRAQPVITTQPQGQSLYAGQNVSFTVAATGGVAPLSYQWQAIGIGMEGSQPFTNVYGANISGATSTNLIITSITAANQADYQVVVTDSAANSVTSTPPATLYVQAAGLPQDITWSVDSIGTGDWNTAADWSDGLGASVSVFAYPGSTYQILPGGAMRTVAVNGNTNFPGGVLQVEGNGVWVNNVGPNIAELRFRNNSNPGYVTFPDLQMTGGQIDMYVGSYLEGEMDILNNSVLYVDQPGGGTTRSMQIDAWLTGTGNIELDGYNYCTCTTPMPSVLLTSTFASAQNVNITGTTNTFSGSWNIVWGMLMGSALNALGTNNITIGFGGALETTYNINNPQASLVLNGQMYLDQSDTFGFVTVAGVALAPGTYTFAQLHAAYPANFPSTWTTHRAATSHTGSGGITVLYEAAQAAPIITGQPAPTTQTLYAGGAGQGGQYSQAAQYIVYASGAGAGQSPLGYQWQAGTTNSGVFTNLIDSAGNIIGSANAMLTLTNLTAANTADYQVIVTNAVGAVTSSVVTLIVQPIGPPLNITLAAGSIGSGDWNTASYWSDNEAASVSALSNPGSTYEILPGGAVRTVAVSGNTNFPGTVLKVDGDGVWYNNGGASSGMGELRFRNSSSPGYVTFADLQMNGGQIDYFNGSFLEGRMDVLAYSVLYVDQAGGGTSRSLQIDAWLTGTGGLELRGYNTCQCATPTSVNSAAFTSNLNITGTTNTFSGVWNIVWGVLMGSGMNSLGTNNITIGPYAALETMYNINSPQASLVLNGQMFLHQNDTFNSVTVNGVALAPGIYPVAQLNAAYPANFPLNWSPKQIGSTTTNASGSLIVSPVTLQIQYSGANVQLSWPQGTLLQAPTVSGPWTTNNATSPYIVNPTAAPQMFYRVQVR